MLENYLIWQLIGVWFFFFPFFTASSGEIITRRIEVRKYEDSEGGKVNTEKVKAQVHAEENKENFGSKENGKWFNIYLNWASTFLFEFGKKKKNNKISSSPPTLFASLLNVLLNL